MAKPREGLPGNSGHMHISIASKHGKNLFARETVDPSPPYPEVAHLSNMGRHFLAGLLEGLPDIMPISAPTINSYKRLGRELLGPRHRILGSRTPSSIYPIDRSTHSKRQSNTLRSPRPRRRHQPALRPRRDPSHWLARSGKKTRNPLPPLGKGEDTGSTSDKGARLAKSLKEANEIFRRPDSVAREVFGDEFVDHFSGTREHEIVLWEEAVTDWFVLYFRPILSFWLLLRWLIIE